MHRRLHLRFFFQSWNHKIAQLKFKQKANETVRNHIMNKFCRMAFLIWRDLTVMARHARNAQWIAVNKIHQQRMTWIFSKWRDVVRTMNFINEVLESATLRSKKKIFIKWIGIVKMQRKIEEIQVCVSSMKRERWLRLLFQWWLHRSFELKKEREGSTAAMIFARSFMLSRVLQRFKQWMHDRQMKEGFSMLASGKLQHVYMKRAFDGWVKHVENRIRKDIACQKLQQISNHYLLAKYFSIIQEIVAANGYLRRTVIEALQVNVTTMKLNKVILWRQQRYRLSLLQQWHKRTISSMMVRDIKKQFSLNVLRRGFYDWKLYVESKERLNTLVIRLSIYHAAFLRRKYWLQWQFQAEKALYQQQFLLFKTLKAWSKYSKMKLFRRYLEHNATSMILQSLQKRILWGWQSYVREISIRREEHQQQRFLEREAKGLAKRTERRQKIEFLSSVFRAWKERFQHVTSILMFLDKKNSQLKRSVWVFWTSWASLSGRARRLRQQWIRSILHSGLNAWRNACTLRICQSKEREAEAARFASWKFLSFVWPRWKSYVAHGRKRAEALQYCLSLIQTIQESNLLRGIIRAWKDYALERGKRREHSWAAEATYKRHKLADYLTAWHDYTAASKESASSLKGTIQVYKGSNHRVHSLANSMYRFHQAFGMIPNFGVHTTCFHDIGAPAVVIEEVSSPVEESQGAIIAHPSHWSSSQEIELNDEAQDLPRLTSNNEDYFQSQGDPSLNKSNLIEYLGLEIEDDVDDWSLNDTDINASN
ncbi:hypothetical protein KP509_35G051400 [Ceratopteris richardii]|nr:hypothetical protein KP509_35G051400 [Ceratopteris richardii]